MRYNRPSFSVSYSIKAYVNVSIVFIKFKGHVKVKLQILECAMDKLMKIIMIILLV